MERFFKRSLSTLSIRAKLLGAVSFLLGSVFIFVVLTVPNQLSKEYIESLKTEAENSSRLISNILISPLEQNLVQNVQEDFSAVKKMKGIEYALVMDAKGDIISEIGKKILEPLHFLKDVQACIMQHHERYDGSGYPHGLKGEHLSIEAQVIALADAYDAMTSGRKYKKTLLDKDVINEIKNSAGKQFNPCIVNAFLKVLEKS